AHEIEPARFLDSVERLVTLAEEGIVDVENGFIRVRPEHRFVVRAVAAAFDAFLANR
ncbi:MAG: coproporphyrinogen III oxidase, partial [Mesorhizobium sp.]